MNQFDNYNKNGKGKGCFLIEIFLLLFMGIILLLMKILYK